MMKDGGDCVAGSKWQYHKETVLATIAERSFMKTLGMLDG